MQEHGTTVVSFVCAVGSVTLPEHYYMSPSGAPWTREQVDSLGQLQILRRKATWRKVDSGQNDIDEADEAAFVKATRAAPRGDGIGAYKASDGTYYDLAGVRLTEAEALEHAVLTDELVNVRCPRPSVAAHMATVIRQTKAAHDSIGGVAACVCTNVPVGLGEPCFDKLEAKLAHAMLSLPATKVRPSTPHLVAVVVARVDGFVCVCACVRVCVCACVCPSVSAGF